METLADLEKMLRETGTRGVTIVFGRSAAPGKRHQFFASTGSAADQVYGDTLAEALGKLLCPQQDDEDILI